jgi:hypothetical protein
MLISVQTFLFCVPDFFNQISRLRQIIKPVKKGHRFCAGLKIKGFFSRSSRFGNCDFIGECPDIVIGGIITHPPPVNNVRQRVDFAGCHIHRNVLVTVITVPDIVPIHNFTCGIRRFLQDKRGSISPPWTFVECDSYRGIIASSADLMPVLY